MKAKDIAEKAAKLTSTDRAKQHGDMAVSHACIAEMWQAYLNAREMTNNGYYIPLTSEDVANMMEALKIARRLTGAFNLDDYVDGAGYAAIAGELRSAEEG